MWVMVLVCGSWTLAVVDLPGAFRTLDGSQNDGWGWVSGWCLLFCALLLLWLRSQIDCSTAFSHKSDPPSLT